MHQIKKIFLSKSNKGFTLVEALVAISILMVAIVTPMSIAQKGLGSATYSKDQMTASFLAQDAIEFIKNKSDEIGLNKDFSDTDLQAWLGKNNASTSRRDLFDKCVSPNGANECYIDTVKDSISNVSGPLKIKKDVSGFLYYGHIAGNSSKFTREISITNSIPLYPDEALITVKVSWPNGGKQESVTIKNFIYNIW